MVVWTMIPCDKATPPKPMDVPNIESALAHIRNYFVQGKYALKDRVDLDALKAYNGEKYTQVELIPDGEFAALRKLPSAASIVMLPNGAGTQSVVGSEAVVLFHDYHGDIKGLPHNERATMLMKATGQGSVALRGDVFFCRLTYDEPSGFLGLGAEAAPQLIMERSWLEAAQAYHKSNPNKCALQTALEARFEAARKQHLISAVMTAVENSSKDSPADELCAKYAAAAAKEKEAASKDASSSPTGAAASGTAAEASGTPSVPPEHLIKAAMAAAQEGASSATAGEVALHWEDAGDEVLVKVVGLPASTKAKHVRCTIKDEYLSLEVLTLPVGKQSVVQGELFQKVNANDSSWSVEDAKEGGRTMVITLEKAKTMRWLMLTRNDPGAAHNQVPIIV